MIEEKIDRLIAVIEKLTAALADAADTQPVVHADEPAPEAEAPKPAAKPAAKPATKAAAPAKAPAKAKPAPEPEPAADEAAAEDPNAPTLQDLRAAAQKCLDAGKLKDIVAINTRFGVRRITEIPADKYAEVIVELNDLVSAAV